MLQLCMARLHLVKKDQSLRNDPLDDHEINLNRFDALIDSLSDVTGTALHLPTGQMSKTGRTLWEEGLDAEWYEYFTGPRE